ncbi:MAG: hypothetical protein IJ315_02055 [Firmicutes bacterium]|nr:hypothetical protein [Bacillota bacterium]
MTNQSQWIWNASAQGSDVYVDFVEKFTGRQGRTYRLELSCDTDYTVWCNGVLAGFGQYGDYINYKVYDGLDLSPYIKSGQNELLITVWYTGLDSQTYIRKPAGLRYEVYEGDQLLQVSDELTLSRPNANYIPGRCDMISSQLGPTFYYDATKQSGEFTSPR